MSFLNLFVFASAMFFLAITPGPGVFATISRALASGFVSASFVVIGIVLGDIIFLLLAIFGLNAFTSILGDLFYLVKYLGGSYLLFLGYKIFTTKEKETNIKAVRELSWKRNFLTGLIITLSNPKVILFYLGFLPTFVNLQTLNTIDTLLISLIVTLVLGSVMLFYAYSAINTKKLFKNKNVNKKMNILAGSIMIIAGASLILKG